MTQQQPLTQGNETMTCEAHAKRWDDRIASIESKIETAEANGRGTKGLRKQLYTAEHNYYKYVDENGNFTY